MHCNNNAIGIEYIIWRARCITPKEGEENRNIDKLSIIGLGYSMISSMERVASTKYKCIMMEPIRGRIFSHIIYI
ncbi:Uncharacterized protein HZ326_20912 [Fusarium oxysporum f. sp. albedinis]|nr:Uncharacterized protein HZ326_20912 [Fusarium oxysporum f. sp. albedinis]